ncbi:putative nuclease [Staphylococcus phage vB_SauH_DELF3]|nr:putative nuclease [Staphylococcus phage vB_SauH_DELF3]
MKVNTDVLFIDFPDMYYKRCIPEGHCSKANRELAFRIKTDSIRFYDILSDGLVGCIPIDIKFIVEADIDVNSRLFGLVTIFKNHSRELHDLWYKGKYDPVVSTYVIKNLLLQAIRTVTHDDTVTIWKACNIK